MRYLFLLLTVSCTRVPQGTQTLTVKTAAHRQHSTIVTFKELEGIWIMPTDTIKPNSTITINFIKK